jgi:hypothetical protein
MEDIKEMMSDGESIKDINYGRMGIKIRKYYNKNIKKTCYTVDYVKQ